MSSLGSGEFTFTDKQWYNFICGFFAGLKLKDLTAPGYISNTVLQPIGIGGSGKIGIKVADTHLVDGETLYDIPVYTHDVDVAYSGFTTAIRFRDPRVQFVSCKAGEFGSVGTASSSADVRYQYDKTSGILYTRGLRASTAKEIKDPMILYVLRVRVSGVVYKSEKLELELLSNGYTNMNSTTLLKYVDISGVPALYYITPLDNKSGYIYGNTDYKDVIVQAPISKPEGVGMKGSPSVVSVGYSVTPPGDRGVLPIYANSNAEEGFAYNKIHVTLTVKDKVIFKYLNVVGNGWSLSVNKSINSEGFLVLDITATRDKALVDSCTFAYIDYEIDSAGTEYSIEVSASDAQLSNTSSTKDVTAYGGLIRFPEPTGGGGGGGAGGGGFGGGGGGGCGGGGGIWSSAGGVAWITADGAPPFPFYLKPGWNKVWWWIPWLFPDDRFVDVIISISAPGYILIPAGFEWWIIEPEGAPAGPVQSKQVEGLKFKDLHDVQLDSIPVPTNIDGTIESIDFADTYLTATLETKLKALTGDDSIDFSDVHNIESITKKIEQLGGSSELLYDDVYSVDGTGTAVNLDDLSESYDYTDVSSTDVESRVYKFADDQVDVVDYDDSSDIIISGTAVNSDNNIEEVYLGDVFSTSQTTLQIRDDTSEIEEITLGDDGNTSVTSLVVNEVEHCEDYNIEQTHKLELEVADVTDVSDVDIQN